MLRRPPRRFAWPQARFEFVGPNAPDRYDPAASTHVRYFTRDAIEPPVDDEKLAREQPLSSQDPFVDPYQVQTELIDRLKGEPGVAGWNDFSWIANTARETLREAAGISVPRRQFVLKMVGLYLLVIVPVNWLVFRLAGRVEWAWLAVPVIAAVWGLLVVWLAQLDIGFARAQTEVAVLEVQPEYPRGHLTRYMALYTSLSSSYDLRFSDPTAVALPFAAGGRLLFGPQSEEVRLTTTGERDLSGYPVASNSTGMVHSEQMFDLGGGIRWTAPVVGSPSVENRTPLELTGAAVVRRRRAASGKIVDEIAWLGDVEPGGRVDVQFDAGGAETVERNRQRHELSAKREEGARGLSLRKLIDCAQRTDNLHPGDVRLVAWHNGALAGVEVTPSTAQRHGATLIVAHLAFGDGAQPVGDLNLQTRLPVANPAFDAP